MSSSQPARSARGAPDADAGHGSPTRRNPWWIPPFLGRVPDVEQRHVSLLGFVALALLFENYDFSLLTSALPFIAHSLDIPERALGDFTGLIRLGALPAFLLIPFADRLGRRRVFLAAVAVLSIGTFLTGLSQTPAQFVALQIATRTAMSTAATIAFVIVAEEFPAAHRGWGIGMLGALSVFGHGLGALLFAAINVLPFGWRALYAVGVVPLLLLPRFRIGVTETERFRRQELAPTSALSAWLGPIRDLARRYPWRATGIAAVGFSAAAGQASVYQFTAQYLLAHRGWQPGQYSTLVIVAGVTGVFGNIAAGRLGDGIGRRAVGFLFMGVFPAVAYAFFHTEDRVIPIVWSALVFLLTASTVISRAFATELFPTSYRGTATGWLLANETLGAATGLALVSAGMRWGLALVTVVSLVSATSAIAAFLVLAFPETRQRELEAISERGSSAHAR
ncbi:MAG TPA: MFS transporter [Candidatus Binatia bacterium]|nr:MFS transporter [Candidatus Binatia bacterium]